MYSVPPNSSIFRLEAPTLGIYDVIDRDSRHALNSFVVVGVQSDRLAVFSFLGSGPQALPTLLCFFLGLLLSDFQSTKALSFLNRSS